MNERAKRLFDQPKVKRTLPIHARPKALWTTDFPPPAGFDGHENGTWGSNSYSRECSAEETGLLDRLQGIDDSFARTAAERSRDRHLADMAAELAEYADLPPAPPSV